MITNYLKSKLIYCFFLCRYYELEAQYGKLDPLAEVDFSMKESETVQVLVSFEGQKPQMQQVKLSWKLNDLYEKFRPLYKGEDTFNRSTHLMFMKKFDSWFCDGQMSLYERTMRGYGLEDGHEIEIVKKNKVKNPGPKWKPTGLKN